MIDTYVASPAELRAAVETWLVNNNIPLDDYKNGQCKIYTQQEWCDRGETIGTDAVLTIISEGLLYRLWNDAPCFDSGPLSRLSKLVDDMGYYFELGYSWSAHLCKAD